LTQVFPGKTALAKSRTMYLYVAPAVIYMIFFSIYPLLSSLYMSFTRYTLAPPKEQFVGTKNYIYILQDPVFHLAITQTLEFVFVAVTLEFTIGLILALILNQRIRGARVFTFLTIMPMTIMPALVGFVWKFMYNGDIGLINYLLSLVGIKGPIWLGNSGTALISVIITDVWQWTPFCFLILLAGLQVLPVEPFEAAKIDGASRWNIFRSLTLPMLKSAIVVALLFRVVDSFKIFDIIYIMTVGGPGNATMVMSLYTYRWAFIFQDLGMASASSYLLLVIVTIFFMIFTRVAKFE
jgi:multiple sugar transport system permease protein